MRYSRKKIAQKEAVSAFVVATNEELANIAQLDDFTISSLKKIHGFGDKKAEKYGKQLLEELKTYSEKK